MPSQLEKKRKRKAWYLANRTEILAKQRAYLASRKRASKKWPLLQHNDHYHYTRALVVVNNILLII